MRKILFRAKRIDNGEWVVSDCIMQFEQKVQLWEEYEGWVYVDPETVGQCTGLPNKNGTEIFEGDICLCDRQINDKFNKKTFEIKFDNEELEYYGESLSGNTITGYDDFYFCEVIGNIYDNPELLED